MIHNTCKADAAISIEGSIIHLFAFPLSSLVRNYLQLLWVPYFNSYKTFHAFLILFKNLAFGNLSLRLFAKWAKDVARNFIWDTLFSVAVKHPRHIQSSRTYLSIGIKIEYDIYYSIRDLTFSGDADCKYFFLQHLPFWSSDSSRECFLRAIFLAAPYLQNDSWGEPSSTALVLLLTLLVPLSPLVRCTYGACSRIRLMSWFCPTFSRIRFSFSFAGESAYGSKSFFFSSWSWSRFRFLHPQGNSSCVWASEMGLSHYLLIEWMAREATDSLCWFSASSSPGTPITTVAAFLDYTSRQTVSMA